MSEREEEVAYVVARVPPELKVALGEMAEEEDRPVAWLVRKILGDAAKKKGKLK